MAESRSHKRTKRKAAGKTGKTETTICNNRRLDATTKSKAVEVERSGRRSRLKHSVIKLVDSGKKQRVLIVPNKDLALARKVMRENCVSGTVKNLSGSYSQHIRPKNCNPPKSKC